VDLMGEDSKPAEEANPKLDLRIESLGEAFVTTQYNALRREIELQIAERRKAENQILISIAAVYAWVLTRDQPLDSVLFRAALCLPVGLACLGFLRWIGIQLRTMTIGRYLNRIERRLSAEEFGWEEFLSDHRKKEPIRGQFEGWSEILIWVLLIAGTILMAVFMPEH